MHFTVPMYEKGRSFILAGGLVKAYEGHRFVYLHLLCQGLECIGKSLLLAHNYEKYEPKLRDNFGHDLEALVAEVSTNIGESFLSEQSANELKVLNLFYKRHSFRYGDPVDFKAESKNICADCLHGELVGYLDELNKKFSSLEIES